MMRFHGIYIHCISCHRFNFSFSIIFPIWMKSTQHLLFQRHHEMECFQSMTNFVFASCANSFLSHKMFEITNASMNWHQRNTTVMPTEIENREKLIFHWNRGLRLWILSSYREFVRTQFYYKSSFDYFALQTLRQQKRILYLSISRVKLTIEISSFIIRCRKASDICSISFSLH